MDPRLKREASTDEPFNPSADPTDRPTRRPIGEVWAVAWPTVLTMASYTMMHFVDALMVGQIGPLGNRRPGQRRTLGHDACHRRDGNPHRRQHFRKSKPGGRNRGARGSLRLGGPLDERRHVAVVPPPPGGRLSRPDETPTRSGVGARSRSHDCTRDRIRADFARRWNPHYQQPSNAPLFLWTSWPKVITVSSMIANVVNIVLNYALIFGEAGIPTLGMAAFPAHRRSAWREQQSRQSSDRRSN